MKIEKMKELHLKACSLIYIDTFNAEPWNDRWDSESSYKRLKDIYETPNFYGLVAAEGDEIIGAVFGNLEQWYEGNMYNLKEIFVKQGIKQRGTGGKLMEALEQSLVKMDVKSISLFTMRGELTEKFYEKNGFSIEADMIMMCKAVTK